MAGLRKCKNCQIGSSYCVMTNAVPKSTETGFSYYSIELYKQGRLNDTGIAPTLVGPGYTCRVGSQDHYNMNFIVENESGFEGPVAFEPSSSEPIVFAQRRNNWESLSTHSVTGDELVTRNWEWDHPFYHMVYSNDPINKTGLVSPNEIVDVVGHENFMLVSDKWTSDMYGEPRKAIGIPRVRYCIGMYGSINKSNHVIEHISMKDNVVEIDWFENFTKVQYKSKKMNIFLHSDKELLQVLIEGGINDMRVLRRMQAAFCLIRTGKYINLYKVLIANGVDTKKAMQLTTRKFSTKNPKQLYNTAGGNRYNMDKLLMVFNNLVDGNLCQPTNEDAIAAYKSGNLDQLKARYEDFRVRYLSNIINYILNDPVLKSTKPDFVNSKMTPAYRYWNAIQIIIKGIQLGLVDMKRIPMWFRELSYQHKNLISDKNRMDRIEGPEENMIAPAVVSVRKYLKITVEQEEAYKLFIPLLRHIKKTTPLELEVCWEHFMKAYVNDEPALFWRYIANISGQGGEQSVIDIHDILDVKSKEDGSLNLGFALYEAMISEDDFRVFDVNLSPDSSLIFPVKGGSSKQPVIENYDAVYNRPWLQAQAIKSQDEFEVVDEFNDVIESGEFDDAAEDAYIEDALNYTPDDETDSSDTNEHLDEDMEFILSDPFDVNGNLKEINNGNQSSYGSWKSDENGETSETGEGI